MSEIEKCVQKTFESCFVQKNLEHCFQLYELVSAINISALLPHSRSQFTRKLFFSSPIVVELQSVCGYLISDNASLMCTSDGSWFNKSDYDNCKPLEAPYTPGDVQCDNVTHPYLCNDYSMMIYSIGYTMSLVSLIIALIILLTLR